MYTSKLILSTKSGDSFKSVLDNCFEKHAQPDFAPLNYSAFFLVNPGHGRHGSNMNEGTEHAH